VAADPLAEFAVLPIADAADVEIIAVRGEHPDRFLVGQGPLPDALTLAGPGEVVLEAVADPTALGPDPKMTTAPGDAPMIFAARPR
jgi:hypothetical protein